MIAGPLSTFRRGEPVTGGERERCPHPPTGNAGPCHAERVHPAEQSTEDPSADHVLQRILSEAGLPASGDFRLRSGWVSRAWVGDEFVVRLNTDPRHREAYRHEARVVGLLADTDVPHALHIAHGEGPDGPWYVSERLPGRTLHEEWPTADAGTRRALIESLGAALQALHRVPVPADLLPPWLAGALSGGAWPAFHPPVVDAAIQQVDAARRAPEHDDHLLDEVDTWLRARLSLFDSARPALVHGDVHGSNVIVEHGRVTGLIDFAEALAQPADAELDTILRWCARPEEFPPTPRSTGLPRASLEDVPRWLHHACPALFASEGLPERLRVYDLCVELAIAAHHPEAGAREAARHRIARLLDGHSHLDALDW